MDIYREEILDHYKNPRNFGALDNPDRVGRAANSLCGDLVEIQLRLKDDRVDDIRFRGIGCAVSTAAGSLLTEAVKGKSLNEVLDFDQNKLLDLLKIELSPTRLKCALLPLEALRESLETEVRKDGL